MQSAFESWVGQHVLVRLTFGKTKLSLRGVLLKDRTETLLMGPEFGSELEIPKKRSEEHTSELQSRGHLVCRLLLEKKKTTSYRNFLSSRCLQGSLAIRDLF